MLPADPLRGQEARQKQVVIGHRGRSRMKIISFLLIIFLCCSNAFCGGSLPREDVIELLKQNHSLWKFVSNTLDLSETAYGVRCGNHWPHMGGVRMAPYTIAATQKGDGGNRFLITIECAQRFFDKDKKQIPMKDGQITDDIISRAVRVEEKPLSVQIVPNEIK